MSAEISNRENNLALFFLSLLNLHDSNINYIFRVLTKSNVIEHASFIVTN